MLLKGNDGVVSELLSWDFGNPAQSYALVKLPDSTLVEWKIQDCLVVEERKTSEQGESPATDRQQLQAKIASCLEGAFINTRAGICTISYQRYTELRQLSAMQ